MDIDSPIGNLPKIGPVFQRKFEKLGIHTINDLLRHAPSRYLDYSKLSHINSIQVGEIVTIHGEIVSITNIVSKRGLRMQIGSVEDPTGKIAVTWFNQPYLVRTLYPGRKVSLSGKVGFFNKKLCLNSPDFELLNDDEAETVHTGRLVPIYPETAGLSSKWIRTKIRFTYTNLSGSLEDPLPETILSKLQLVSLNTALKYVHFPKNLEETQIGRKRLAFDELLNLQLKTQYRKSEWNKNKANFIVKTDKSGLSKFIDKLPFSLTASQEKAIDEILSDMGKELPMNRLLEGDVGSGKTVVAAAASYMAFLQGYQTVIMAPTQILATQHFKTLSDVLKPFGVKIRLATSDSKKAGKSLVDVFVGTHALLHKKVEFDKVALVVIDEQHRFGVEQRSHLAKKSGTPHILTMTATPIPRTVTLTAYGDLDLSLLKEMPKGRKKINTWVVPEIKRPKAYKWIDEHIEKGSQVFVVCPLIEDSEAETLLDVKSVTTEYEKLKRIFKERKIGLLHGRLKAKEKDEVLQDFKSKKTDLLVSTPVVEVGIDIPNATIMMIEAAERFGLAQLHQLRGRVGRGEKKSYCLLFSNIKYSKRLKAMEKNHSGFELSEIDLKLRGPGEIFGTLQSGFSELKIADWSDTTLIKTVKEVAEDIIANPDKYPKISEKMIEKFNPN